MPHRRGFADTGVRGEHAEAGVVDELPEGALKLLKSGALLEEGLPLGVLGERVAGQSKALAVHARHSSLFVFAWRVGSRGAAAGVSTGRIRW
jgi:hypothetical protein